MSFTNNTASTSTPKRQPTITYPVLHLDSFTTDLFPSHIQAGPSKGRGNIDLNEDEDRQYGDETRLRDSTSASQSFLRQSSSSSRTLGDQQRHDSYDNYDESMLHPAQGSSSTSTRLPPPPSLALPALPTLSPITPVYALPESDNNMEGSYSLTGPRPQKSGTPLTINIPRTPPSSRVAPPLRDSPGIPRRRTIVEHQGYQGVPLDVEGLRLQSKEKETPRRLDKKASMQDLKASPTASSPTAKRSLPRPPEMVLPTASTTWPIPTGPKPVYTSQQQKSATILPIVSGLADAGPYPTTTPRQSAIGLGKPPSARAPPKMQEEVCLECMMRDRDLADIQVNGPGCWSRQSDADWDELKWREEALLSSMTGQSAVPSLEDDGSSDSGSTSAPSTGISSEDVENKRKMVIEKQHRMAVRAKRREADERVLKEVGWRGFKWEEGNRGEGLPRGFRGTVGGPLSVEAIKGVMTKYPKASEHRYEYLHNYLQHQWRLVLEIRAEASRRGGYPAPSEIHYSDSISSHEPIPRARTSSISWEQHSAREPIREPFASPSVRPSPSTPSELTGVRNKPSMGPRPHTQLLPEATERINPHSARSRYEKGISSPGTLERSPQPDRWDDDDALWSPVSGGDGSLRPFSFAVRAGAAAGRDGEGSGRKSLFRQWGGSVTSFFGGSQGGSGSMMDMHLGLDADRRAAYPNSTSAHRDVYPRAVSMASPSRPSFFSKDSRSSIDNYRDRDPRTLTKSISSSRLSQVVRNEETQEPKKKKGLKGLIQKMKPKSKRQSSDIPPLPHHTHHRQPQPNDVGTPLAPPPNMAYLSGDGQQRHHRNSSQSSMADSQVSNWKMRSVSAPIGGSSSGSQSASPTSSKYRRESYNSQLRANEDDRGATMEMLHPPGNGNGNGQYQPQRQMYASPEPGYDERRSSAAQPVNGYPNPSFRTSKYASGSISNSSGVAATIETPPMPLNATPFFSRPPSINSPANMNRFKNLPPLPPTDDRMASSPESFHYLHDPTHNQDPNRKQLYTQPTHLYPQGQPPRASFDRPTNTPRAEPSPRMVHSMYAQPTSSNLSFGSGRFPPMQQQGMHSGGGGGGGFVGEGEKKKKGFKGFFGGARAGRMA